MMKNRLLVDSSYLYALFDTNDRYHGRAIALTHMRPDATLVIPYIVLTEAAFLARRMSGVTGVIRFLSFLDLVELEFEPLPPTDLRRAREIMIQYATANLDFVDCCIMAASERLNITQICTFDRRDFSIFQPKHIPYIELLP